MALTYPIVPESHADLGHRRFDLAGAISVTGGLALFIYAISKAPEIGWATGQTIGLLIVSRRGPRRLRHLGAAGSRAAHLLGFSASGR